MLVQSIAASLLCVCLSILEAVPGKLIMRNLRDNSHVHIACLITRVLSTPYAQYLSSLVLALLLPSSTAHERPQRAHYAPAPGALHRAGVDSDVLQRRLGGLDELFVMQQRLTQIHRVLGFGEVPCDNLHGMAGLHVAEPAPCGNVVAHLHARTRKCAQQLACFVFRMSEPRSIRAPLPIHDFMCNRSKNHVQQAILFV